MRLRRPRPAAGEIPPRPYIPPSAFGAATALGTAGLLAESAWRGRAAGTAPWLDGAHVVGVLVLCAAALAASRALAAPHPRAAARLRWMGALGLLAALGCARWAHALEASSAVLERPVSAFALEVASDPTEGAFGWSFTVVARDDAGRAVARMRATAGERPARGEVLRAVGRAKALDGSTWARSRLMRGEVAQLTVVRVLERSPSRAPDPLGALRSRVLAAIDPRRSPARALIAGAVCGDDSALDGTAAADDFAAAGLSHLVAVSGGHLVLVAALLQRALQRARAPVGARNAGLAAAMTAYVVFCGCTPSAVRSAAMACMGLAAGAGGRRAHSLSALALTCTGFAAIDSGAVFDLGFQLSAASVLFIAVFGRYLSFLLARTGLPHGVSEALSLTLAAQWATLPLTLPAFGTLSLVAPLANLVCGPLMSAMLVCGLATAPAAAAVPALSCLLAVPEALAQLSVFAAAVLADLPYASIPFSASAAGAAAALYLPALAVFLAWRPWGPRAVSALAGALVAAGAGWVGYWTLDAPPRVTVMDVGQADSILVRDGASSLLVDAGVDGRVVDALARNRVYRLDAVVVTHWDADHWGGLPDLLAAVDVGALYVARGAAGSAPPELLQALPCEISELGYGDRLAVGGFSCRVVWPRAPVAGEENAEPLVLDVRYRDGGCALSVLLTGDAEAPEAERFAPEVGDIDVLKLGHHGSAASVDASMLSVLDPEVAVASAGEGNAYGHPAPACTQAVAACGARFLCTIDAGDVELAPAEGGVGVSAGRGAG